MLRFAIVCLLPLVFAAPNSPQVSAQTKAVATQTSNWEKPSFCKINDCPIFVTTARENGYEVRTYQPARWVSTEVEAIDYQSANSIAFNRLFRYIDGNNERREKIQMTTPVPTRVIPGSGPNCESTFKMSFYLPYSYQDGRAPAPSDSTVFLESTEEFSVYVRAFPGFASIDDYLRNALELTRAIGADGDFNRDYWYTVGYNSPYEIFNRHNEVWFLKN